jgi:hypothetical protein
MNNAVDLELDMIIAKLHEIAPVIKAQGVTRLAVFGSRVRGDAGPDSDLDVLLDSTSRGENPAGENPPSDIFKIQHLIEDATGLSTQISMRKMLKPRMAERIADDLSRCSRCRPASKIAFAMFSKLSLESTKHWRA